MPLQRQADIGHIEERLGVISATVKHANAIQLYDIDKVLEDFCTGLFNIAFDLNLVNINNIKKNAAAIDLGDDDKRIAVQITSDKDGNKIKETVSKFVEHGLYKKYDRLIVFILVDKQGSYSVDVSNKANFAFSLKKDICNFEDFMREVNSMSTEKISLIRNYIDREFPAKANEGKTHYESWMEILKSIEEQKEYTVALEAQVLLPTALLYKFNTLRQLVGECGEHIDYRDFLVSNVYSAFPEEDREEADRLQQIGDIYGDYSGYDEFMSGITAWVDVPMYEKRVVNYGEETKMIRELVPKISKLRKEIKDDIIVYMREHVV